MTRTICLWEAPRSRGTTIAYALYNGLRAGGYACEFSDEPFHPRRLASIETGSGAAAKAEYIRDIKSPERDGINFIIRKEQAKWLYLDRTKADVGDDLDWIKNYTNIILLRDPYEMIASHQQELSKEGKTLFEEQVGIAQLFRLSQFLEMEIRRNHTLIVDSNELLAEPERGMKRLCQFLHIPFSGAMLRWGKPDIEAPIWGTHWYDGIMNSRGLQSYQAIAERPFPWHRRT